MQVKVKTLRAWQTVYHLMTWVLSFVGTAVAFFLRALGDTGYRCARTQPRHDSLTHSLTHSFFSACKCAHVCRLC